MEANRSNSKPIPMWMQLSANTHEHAKWFEYETFEVIAIIKYLLLL